MNSVPLTQSFFARDPVIVARELVGKLLWRETPEGLAGGRIVETEAYLSSRDAACHATRGMTRKNETMFGPAGRAYVYMIHAKWLLNAVTEEVGQGSAVLLRAIEPLEGVELMRLRRGKEDLRDLARGPARLCQALAVTKAEDGWDLTRGQGLWIAEPIASYAFRVLRSPRIGITRARHRLLRFFEADSPFVSGRKVIGRR